jgi:surface polysaccharide O-acyltransferase-like enzyme
VEFKITKPEAKENIKKITPRKILALWLIASLVLTILAPKLFDLKDYKNDQILFTILVLTFLIMLLIVYLVKTIKGSSDKNR